MLQTELPTRPASLRARVSRPLLTHKEAPRARETMKLPHHPLSSIRVPMPIARVSRRRTALSAAVTLVALFAAAPLAARLLAQGPPPQLHATFDSLLRQHVRDGLVNYDAMARAPQFAAYLGALARTRSDGWPRADRLAFLINAYNAYTIAQVNAHNERRSIRNINKSFGVVGRGAWGEKMATIGGVTLTLDEIEHERIRPVFNEPRIHFALVCAARGCPPLRAEAYRGEVLDQQLTDQAHAFLLRSPAKNRFDVASATVYLSPIFKWYGGDFGQDDAARLRYIGTFLPNGAEAQLLATGRARIRWTDYDWSLNIFGQAR